MRLLHTEELRFEEFFDKNIPRYAILSHTWGPDEVSFQEFSAIRKEENEECQPQTVTTSSKSPEAERVTRAATTKAARLPKQRTIASWVQQRQKAPGYRKIIACCKHAATDTTKHATYAAGPYERVWIDTCCIDKTSSAELSEAINSMFFWYERASICYACLSDVPKAKSKSQTLKLFGASRWFSRGWTLQELLAPEYLVFLDQDWAIIGKKNQLSRIISEHTGIPEEPITAVSRTCAADIFSWAAARQTSRREDQAYCLLGLLGINMPLLYGEGDGACRRLQMEIIRTSNDESIFVWDKDMGHTVAKWGVLSTQIRDFSHWQKSAAEWTTDIRRPPYSITNQGLEIRIPKHLAEVEEFLLPLDCPCVEEGTLIGAYAIMLSQRSDTGLWSRIFPSPRDIFVEELGNSVRRLHATSGLFVVPFEWVWSRDSLEERGSSVIYVDL